MNGNKREEGDALEKSKKWCGGGVVIHRIVEVDVPISVSQRVKDFHVERRRRRIGHAGQEWQFFFSLDTIRAI